MTFQQDGNATYVNGQPVAKSDVRALWAAVDGVVANNGKFFGSRADAVAAGQAALPASLGRVIVEEGDYIVWRGPGQTGDQLFSSYPNWGIVRRVPTESVVNALVGDLRAEVRNGRVWHTTSTDLSDLTPPPGTDQISVATNAGHLTFRRLTVAPGDPDPAVHQQTADDTWWQLSEDSRAIKASIADLARRNVATIWGGNFSATTFPAGTDTVIQRQAGTAGDGFYRLWATIAAPETPDPAIQQQDATGGWWVLFFDSGQIEFRGTRVYAGRADALSLITNNPPPAAVHRVFSIEDGYLVTRARNSQLDALFETAPYWGVQGAVSLGGSPLNPIISGRPNVGEFLDVDLGKFADQVVEMAWQWHATGEGTQGWSVISGASSPSYRIGEEQEGRFLRIRTRREGATWVVSNVIGPIGERLAGSLPDDVSAATTGAADIRSRRPRLHDSVATLHDLRDGVGAPPPLDLYRDYSLSVGTEWLGNVTAPLPTTAANLLTTYAPAENVIHPCMVEFFNEFCGYRYVCAITAYPSGPSLEDPFVYGSNDRVNWTFLGAAPQPLDVKLPVSGSYNSDTFVTHDPRTGELIVGYRLYAPRSDGDSSAANSDVVLICRTTRNGYAWSEPREIMRIRADEQIMLAPTMILDPETGTWHMWVINRPVMNHWTAPSLYGPWTMDDVSTPLSMFNTPHHHEIKWVGDKLVCLMYSRNDGNLFFGVFEDGSWTEVTWNMTGILNPRPASLYKASFTPIIDFETNRVAFDIWWTVGAAGPAGGTEQGLGRRLQYARTNMAPVSLEVIPDQGFTITVLDDPAAFAAANPGPNELVVLTDA